MTLRKLALTAAAVVLGGAAVFLSSPLGRDIVFHVLPFSWTGEAERLARALAIRPGNVVADIGAGNGALIVELSRMVGPNGRAWATERTERQLRQISDRARAAAAPVTVITAGDLSTNLPDACCDVVTMRLVAHHIADRVAFALDLRRTLRPGGRVAIIDFAPGSMPHLDGKHGVRQDAVIEALQRAGFTVTARDDDWGGRTFLIVFTAP